MKYKIIPFIILFIFYSFCYANENDENRARLKKRFAHIPKLTADQAYYLFKGKKVVLVDANSRIRFKRWHAVGAINIPGEKVNKLKIKLNKNTTFAIY